jgi:CBS domain-containing protein
MKIGIKVGDIMTRNFIAVSPETSIIDCAREMIKRRVGSLILKENNKLLGIITEKDIIWVLTKKPRVDLSRIKAKEISPRKLATIKPSADLQEALDKMRKTKFRRLPVIVQGNVIGLLTLKDILRIQPNLFETASEIMQIKEEEEKLKKLKSASKREGMCEECGNFDSLNRIDGRLLCESCKEAM